MTISTIDNWNNEWKKYNAHPYFKPNKKVIKIIKLLFSNKLSHKKILELGAGSGCDIVSLAKAGAQCYALDKSTESIRIINYWADKTQTKINIIRSDIHKLPFPNKYFDLVYSVGLMEHFSDPLSLLKKQVAIIKPKGFLITDVPQKYTLYTIAKHIRMKYNIHPFGWETEYSKYDLIKLAHKLNQQPLLIYGRDFDVYSKLPKFIQPLFYKILFKHLEQSFLAPYLCLNIGLILKIS